MEKILKNTKFDNLVNYETNFNSNSSQKSISIESSADPNSLTSLIKNSQFVKYSVLITLEKIIIETESQKIIEE